MSLHHAQGRTLLVIEDGIAWITFERPAARNAMTWEMYEQLESACRRIRGDGSLRAVVLQGAGGEAFVAGTAIEQFEGFDARAGVEYEARVDAVVRELETLPLPTIAFVRRWAVGAGLILANACDLRLASAGSRFGVPIARTLGNCLSVANTARLSRTLGPALVQRMLMLAEMPTAEQLPAGYAETLAVQDCETRLAELCVTLRNHAPLTLRAAKAAMLRTREGQTADDADIVGEVYGSRDFAAGVRAFLDKQAPAWSGH